MTDGHEQDPSQVPDLLSQIDQEIDQCIADGIYEQQPIYAAVESHSPGAPVIIPSRKVAAPRRTAATSPTQREQHIAAIEQDGLFAWKRALGYDVQSHAEHTFARYKRTCGGRLWAKREESQEQETEIACTLLNRMRVLGQPQSDPVRSKPWWRGQCGAWPIHATHPDWVVHQPL